ncbi:hypothetical protein ACIBIZ_14580 [Nonomuraea spiralis]|uniref:hypothetical protein n=1 Tax=Nonomuraea spiralis TaxID=46182 RepID=UPI00378A9659
MVVGEAGEQVDQVPPVGVGQRGQELVLGAGQQPVEVGQQAAAVKGFAGTRNRLCPSRPERDRIGSCSAVKWATT